MERTTLTRDRKICRCEEDKVHGEKWAEEPCRTLERFRRGQQDRNTCNDILKRGNWERKKTHIKEGTVT